MEHLYPLLGSGLWTLNLTVAAMILVASVITFVICRLAVAKLDVHNPGKLQNFMEWVIEFVHGLAKDFMDPKQAQKFVPMAVSLMLYLFIANQMGVIFNFNTVIHHPIPFVPESQYQEAIAKGHATVSWWLSPTANTSVPIALALGVFLLSHGIGLRHPKEYFSHFKNPMHLIEEITKPVTHSLRLWGNIFAGEVLIAVIIMIPTLFGFVPVGAIPLIIWLGYSLFVGTIQAFVFTILTLLYVGQKLPHEQH